MVDMGDGCDGWAEDIIKVIIVKVGVEKILAVTPKQNRMYEVTLENEEMCENLLDGLEIKGWKCEVKKLQEREYVDSFMHLHAYLGDNHILDKLKGLGVTPYKSGGESILTLRMEPGTGGITSLQYQV